MSADKPIDDCDENERCDIIDRVMFYDIGDAQYPVEWVFRDDGQPSCTAFVPAGEPIPPPKDDRTIDMFGRDPLLNEAIDRLVAGERG